MPFDEALYNDPERMYSEAVKLVRSQKDKLASVGLLQQSFEIGFNRACRIIERMEAEGIVSRRDHDGRRTVL